MKIVITSNIGPEHEYLWRKIMESGHDVFIFAQTHLKPITAIKTPFVSKIKRRIKFLKILMENPHFATEKKLAERGLYRFYLAALNSYFPANPNLLENLKQTGKYFEFENINSVQAVEKITDIKPDLIVVHGGKILKPEFFGASRFGAIHLHGGIVPWYRGGNTWFPNIINNDFHYIGPTVQEIDAGIDTGNVIHQHTIVLDKNDTPWTIYCKTVIVGVEILLACIALIAATRSKITSTPIAAKGFNYLKGKRIKSYEPIIVYSTFKERIANHLISPLTFIPSLVQQKELMINHSFIKY